MGAEASYRWLVFTCMYLIYICTLNIYIYMYYIYIYVLYICTLYIYMYYILYIYILDPFLGGGTVCSKPPPVTMKIYGEKPVAAQKRCHRSLCGI